MTTTMTTQETHATQNAADIRNQAHAIATDIAAQRAVIATEATKNQLVVPGNFLLNICSFRDIL